MEYTLHMIGLDVRWGLKEKEKRRRWSCSFLSYEADAVAISHPERPLRNKLWEHETQHGSSLSPWRCQVATGVRSLDQGGLGWS